MKKQQSKSIEISKMISGFVQSLNSKSKILNSNQKGQTMLLTVLIMFGIILSATTIGGYLMLNQLRQARNAANSVKAIMAADAGIECELYKMFKDDTIDCSTAIVFEDSNVTITTTSTSPMPGIVRIRSTGGSARTFRAFELTVTTATSTP